MATAYGSNGSASTLLYGNHSSKSSKSSTSSSSSSFTSHAVSRSSELLSCGKTALKIAQSQHQQQIKNGAVAQDEQPWWLSQDPNTLQLFDPKHHVPQAQNILQVYEDGLALLRAMDTELLQLEKLVRRRGHTNDPTEEIARSVQRLETDAQELSTLVKTGFQIKSGRRQQHYQKHLSHVSHWLETVAAQQLQKLKEILKVRGNVLADQAQRRKLLNPAAKVTSATAATSSAVTGTASTATRSTVASSSAMVESPLFTMTSPSASSSRIKQTPAAAYNSNNNNGAYSSSHNGASSGYGGARASVGSNPYYSNSPGGYGAAAGTPSAGNQYYMNNGGGGYGAGGYSSVGGYGGGSTSFGTGMRQRRNASQQQQQQPQESENDTDSSAYIANQIQERQYQRETQNRLQEAQKAEKTLAHLGTMFSKMSTLISQQSELIEKVEDDMEAGLAEVTMGQQEIANVYSIKKGNRGLIIKVFALLIFLIIFMRFGYKK